MSDGLEKKYQLTKKIFAGNAAIIAKIESYGAKYDPDSDFSAIDQLAICETVVEATPVSQSLPEPKKKKLPSNAFSNANTNVKWLMLPLSEPLKYCPATTPPRIVAVYLEHIFGSGSKPDHWLWIAQHYTPHTIYLALKAMRKTYLRGDSVIRNPPAYFTGKIKFYRQRRRFD